MKLAVIGSRRYPDIEQVWEYVRSLPHDTFIITGGDAGVDLAAENAARERRMSRVVFEPARPEDLTRKEYRQELIDRNERIIRAADAVAAFHNGHSRVTYIAMCYAKRVEKPLSVFYPRVLSPPIEGPTWHRFLPP